MNPGQDFSNLYRQAVQTQGQTGGMSGIVSVLRFGKQASTPAYVKEDLSLMDYFYKRGFLSVIPGYETKGAERDGTHIALRLGRPGQMRVEVCRKTRPRNFGKISDPVMARWLILLHECSHQEFSLEARQLQLTESSMPTDLIEKLGQWSIFNVGGSAAADMISENFADAYAAMMLDQAMTEAGLDGAEASIEQLRVVRRIGQDKTDAQTIDHLRRGELECLLTPVAIHMTARTLARVQKTRSEWIALGPEQIKQRAMEMAANSWMEELGVENVAGRENLPLGLLLRLYAIPPSPDKVMETISRTMVSGFLEGANPVVMKSDMSVLPAHYRILAGMIMRNIPKFIQQNIEPNVRRENKPEGVGVINEITMKNAWAALVNMDGSGQLKNTLAGVYLLWKKDSNDIAQEFILNPAKEIDAARNYPIFGELMKTQMMIDGHQPTDEKRKPAP